MEPANPFAHLERARALLGLERGDEALAAFDKTIELGARDPRVLNNTAWALIDSPSAALRYPDRAVELAGRAAKITPDAWFCWSTLGTALYRKGRWTEALESRSGFAPGTTSLHIDGSSSPWPWRCSSPGP